jgi:hypothetical protein
VSNSGGKQALFEGLVFTPQGEPAAVAMVGSEPCYVIPDAGFRRHVEAEKIDRQVMEWLQQQILSNQELVIQGTMSLLGQDDLFTKAMIDASLQDLDKQAERLMNQGLPAEIRAWLGMLGFRVVVNVHGELVEIEAAGRGNAGDW